MWVGKVQLSEINRRARWKVEFFTDDIGTSAATRHAMLPIRALVDERAETIDPQLHPEHMFGYIGLENVESLTGDLSTFIPKAGSEILSRSKVFRSGDVLYGRLRPNLNKVYLAQEPIGEGICSGEFYVLIPDRTKVLPRFLRAMLASKHVHSFVRNWQTGSALPRLQLDDLLDLAVPVPTLAEQQHYDEFILKCDSERREAKTRAQLLTEAAMSALEVALEEGTSPSLNRSDFMREQVWNLSLPEGEFIARRKSRSAAALF